MFKDEEILLAAKTFNINPLLSSIFKQTNSELIKEGIELKSQKYYFNSNKPLGNSKSQIDFKTNIRSKLLDDLNDELDYKKKQQLLFKQEIDNKNKLQLVIPETYNENDPDIQILKDFEKSPNCDFIKVEEELLKKKKHR